MWHKSNYKEDSYIEIRYMASCVSQKNVFYKFYQYKYKVGIESTWRLFASDSRLHSR